MAPEETLFLATLHEELGDTQEAESLLHAGIAMSAGYQRGEWVYCAGDGLFRKSRFREAFKAWDKALYPAGGGSLTDPRFADSGAEPPVRRGFRYAESGDYAKASVEFGKAYSIDSTLQLPNFLLAATAYATGKGNLTREHFVQTVQHPGLELPGQHGPDRIQIAAAALLLWVLQKGSSP